MRPNYPRTCVPSTEIQSLSTEIQRLADIVQCTFLFSVRVSLFLAPLYPRLCVPSTTIESLAGILRFTCLFSVRMLPFLVPFSPIPMRPKHKDSVGGWYPAVHESVFSSDGTFSGAPLPTSMRPKHRDSAAGWYPAVHVFSSSVRYYLFWSPFLCILRCHASVLSAKPSA